MQDPVKVKTGAAVVSPVNASPDSDVSFTSVRVLGSTASVEISRNSYKNV